MTKPVPLRIAAISVFTILAMAARADDTQVQALFDAVHKDDPAAVAKAISDGAQANSRDKIGDTPLVVAAREGRQQALEALLKANAKADLRSTYGKSPLIEAATNGKVKAVQTLLTKVKVDTTDSEGTCLLIAAAVKGDLPLMQMALDKGARIEQQDVTGATALMRAAGVGRINAMKLLIDKHADPKRLDRWGRTALFYAAVDARIDATKMLLDAGYDPKLRDKDGLNPFQAIIDSLTAGSTVRIDDRIAVLKILQERTGVDARDAAGRSALIIASERGVAPIVKYLLAEKAEVNARDKSGRTALDWAEVKMRDDVVILLKQAGGMSGG